MDVQDPVKEPPGPHLLYTLNRLRLHIASELRTSELGTSTVLRCRDAVAFCADRALAIKAQGSTP